MPKETSSTFTRLAYTTEQSGSMKAPLYFDVQKQWTMSHMPMKHIIVSGILEQKKANGLRSRICIVTDGDFPIGGSGNKRQKLQPDNVNLMVNSIDWMSDDTGLKDLRTQGVQYRTIDELEDGTKSLLKYLNFLLPILLVVIYGLIRMQANRVKRIKRMEESYE